MNYIKVALSHYCCRTTLQCQCHETVQKLSINRVRQPKQYSLEFAAEGEQGRHVTWVHLSIKCRHCLHTKL